MNMKWLDPFDDLPSWTEMGKRIEAELNNGEIVTGIIEEYDMTSGDDEQPLFLLKTDESEFRWFDDIKRFRYLPEAPQVE